MFVVLMVFLGCDWFDETVCPSGLVPVPKDNPTVCVHPFEAKIKDNGVVSEKGLVPDINISLNTARVACSSTVIDGKNLRLITFKEWLLAGGAGEFPWGERDDSRCVLDSIENTQKWSDVQPAGSMEGCVSEHGIFDQIGNAWEWVDLEQTASKEAWLNLVESYGYDVEVSQTKIELDERIIPRLNFRTICVVLNSLTIKEEYLIADLQEPNRADCLDAGQGYLWFRVHPSSFYDTELPLEGSLLPVELWGDRIVWDKSRDGERVGAKVGGSFYSGGQSTLNSYWIGHIPSFDGSIGFRCTADRLDVSSPAQSTVTYSGTIQYSGTNKGGVEVEVWYTDSSKSVVTIKQDTLDEAGAFSMEIPQVAMDTVGGRLTVTAYIDLTGDGLSFDDPSGEASFNADGERNNVSIQMLDAKKMTIDGDNNPG